MIRYEVDVVRRVCWTHRNVELIRRQVEIPFSPCPGLILLEDAYKIETKIDSVYYNIDGGGKITLHGKKVHKSLRDMLYDIDNCLRGGWDFYSDTDEDEFSKLEVEGKRNDIKLLYDKRRKDFKENE